MITRSDLLSGALLQILLLLGMLNGPAEATCPVQKLTGSSLALHLQDTTPRALQPVTCHAVRTRTMQAYARSHASPSRVSQSLT